MCEFPESVSCHQLNSVGNVAVVFLEVMRRAVLRGGGNGFSTLYSQNSEVFGRLS